MEKTKCASKNMKRASNFRTNCASKIYKMRFQKLFSVKNALPKYRIRFQNYNYFTNGFQKNLNKVQNALPK